MPAIRSTADVGYVYVILLTATDGNSAIEGLSAGADDLMRKPFNPAEVAVRVRTAERILGVETRDLAIFAMAKLAESRDPESGKHLERVRHYARLLALDLSQQPKYAAVVDASYVRLIYLTSPLHDIGKVAIPDSVLLKPGRLSDREFGIMKMHTTFGAQTLAESLREHPEASFLVMAKEIAETHHERVDGSGYPNGLKADAIPLSGRIVAVADVYDALTSRPAVQGPVRPRGGQEHDPQGPRVALRPRRGVRLRAVRGGVHRHGDQVRRGRGGRRRLTPSVSPGLRPGFAPGRRPTPGKAGG